MGDGENIEADQDYLETMKARMRGNVPTSTTSSSLNIKKSYTTAVVADDNCIENDIQAIMDSAQRRTNLSSAGVRSPDVKSNSSSGVQKKNQNSNSANFLRGARRHETAKSSADLPDLYKTANDLRAEADRLER